MVTNDPQYMREYARKNYEKYRGTEKAKKKRAQRNQAHRMMNPPKGMEAHHIDGDTSNNKRSNLRSVSKLFNERKP